MEEDVVKKIVTLLWYSGIPCFRQRERVPSCPSCGQFVSAPSDPGQPDLHGWIPPRKFEDDARGPVPFYIEVKRPSGGIRGAEQVEFIKRAAGDGVLAFFANSWEIVKAEFLKVGIVLPEG